MEQTDSFFKKIRDDLIDDRIRIGFNEIDDERVLRAVQSLSSVPGIVPILIGDTNRIEQNLSTYNLDIEHLRIFDPGLFIDKEAYAQRLYQMRREKGMTQKQAVELLEDIRYFSMMLLDDDEVDAIISGASFSTADTLLPAFQVIGTKEGVHAASSFFLMKRDEEILFFSDCGVHISPNAEQLAEIAIQTYDSACLFGQNDLKVALLSYSTKGSSSHENLSDTRLAVDLIKKRRPEIVVDGELQFDAAYVPDIAKRKAPESPIQGDAKIFIFPDLEAGNIAYKITEYLGRYQAFGPIVQGLCKPVTDLSRGCTSEDIYSAALLTAYIAKHK